MRKSLVTSVLVSVCVIAAAFGLSGLASAAERPAYSDQSVALSAPLAKATPTAMAKPTKSVGTPMPTATVKPAKSVGTPTPTRKAPARAPKATATIPAPKLRDYQNPVFSWTWNGTKQMGKQDWYFDIQIYQATAQDPYHVVVAEPGKTKLENGIYSYNEAVRAQCNSFWVVQIAQRINGRFAGWVSPKSDRLPIGGSCGGGGGGGGGDGGSQPAPPPQPTKCPGCP